MTLIDHGPQYSGPIAAPSPWNLTKTQLVDALVRGGTIYPTRPELLRLPKDELVSMVLSS